MLKKRIQNGLILGGAVVAAVFFLPQFSIITLLILLSFCLAMTLEFCSLLDAGKIRHFKGVSIAGGLLLITATWYGRGAAGPVEWDYLAVLAVVVFLLLRLFPQKENPEPIQTAAATLLAFLYVPFLFNFFTKLLVSWPGRDGRALVIYMLVVVKLADVGAFFIGCNFGKHKLFPRLSPLKTWEGFLGGLATSMISSVLFCLFARGNLRVVHLTLADSLILGALLCTCGTLGDLTESLFKRAAGVKDSSSVIAGMGGVLDVMDSTLLAAPVMYVYARFLLEPLA